MNVTKAIGIITIVIAIVIMAIPSSVAHEEHEFNIVDCHCYGHRNEIRSGIQSNIKAITGDDGKIILYSKLSRNEISLKGKEIIVIADIDGIESKGTKYTATVTDSYKKDGMTIVKICINCNLAPFETQIKMDGNGDVRLVHFTGVTYFLKGIAGENLEQIDTSLFYVYDGNISRCIEESIIGSTV